MVKYCPNTTVLLLLVLGSYINTTKNSVLLINSWVLLILIILPWYYDYILVVYRTFAITIILPCYYCSNFSYTMKVSSHKIPHFMFTVFIRNRAHWSVGTWLILAICKSSTNRLPGQQKFPQKQFQKMAPILKSTNCNKVPKRLLKTKFRTSIKLPKGF